jgi:phosphomevalonate kinase
MRVVASAPGKAVLIGEYAVLNGSPALVLAVNRRARVSVQACSRNASQIEVPQLGLEPVKFRLMSDMSIDWLDHRAEQPAFQRARQTLEWQFERGARRGAKVDGLQIHIDTSELYQQTPEGEVKLGIGSSAAMTVALAGALEAIFDPAPVDVVRDRLWSVLLAPYREGQGGLGSGIDIAASLFGGCQRFQLTQSGANVNSVRLPKGLEMVFVWAGASASTPDFLACFDRWRSHGAEQSRHLLQQMDKCCGAALEFVQRDDAAGFMTCINNFRRFMGKIGEMMDAPVLSRPLEQIIAAAESAEVACKPCGAGGGDLALLAGTDVVELDAAVKDLERGGWPDLGLSEDGVGLQFETGPA